MFSSKAADVLVPLYIPRTGGGDCVHNWREGRSRYIRFTPCLLGIVCLSLIVSCYPLQARLTHAQARYVPLEKLAHLRCAHANFALSQWQSEQHERLYPPEHRITWMLPKEGLERGVAVLIHGLNNKPTTMNAIANVLNEAGVRVLRVTLQGHGCLDIHDFQAVSMEAWFYDLLTGILYCFTLCAGT